MKIKNNNNLDWADQFNLLYENEKYINIYYRIFSQKKRIFKKIPG